MEASGAGRPTTRRRKVAVAGLVVLGAACVAVVVVRLGVPWRPGGGADDRGREFSDAAAKGPTGAREGSKGTAAKGVAGPVGATGATGPTEGDKIPYAPPPVKDARIADFVNRESKNPRVTPDISSRIPFLESPEDVAAMRQVLMDPKDNDTVRHEAANILRRSGYRDLTADLERVLQNPQEGERFRGWAIQHLFLNYDAAEKDEQQKIKDLLNQYATDPQVNVQREAVLALHRLEEPRAREIALAWLHAEKDAGARDLAMRIVREQDLRGETPTIRKYLHDEDPVVRIAAIVTLSEWGDTESIPAFEEAAKSDVVRIQRAGALALKRVRNPRPPRPDQPGPIR